MIVCFGDIHFSTDKIWSDLVNNRIIEFVNNLEENNSNNIAIFTGDIIHRALSIAECYSYILKLCNILRFKHTYIVLGNHDFSFHKNTVTNALSIISKNEVYNKKITVITKPTILNIENLNVYFVPYLSSLLHSEQEIKNTFLIKDKIDLFVGHGIDITSPLSKYVSNAWDLSQLNAIEFCIGHIHLTDNNRYIGSIIPTSVNENSETISIWTYEKINGTVIKKIKRFPSILYFNKIIYPDPILNIDKNKINLFIVYNCNSEFEAKEYYSKQIDHFYLYSIQNNFLLNIQKDYHLSNAIILDNTLNLKDLFKLWKETKTQEIPKDILEIAEKKFLYYIATR